MPRLLSQALRERVAVSDGDGPIWCAERPKIRLAGLAAREYDKTCNAHRPCWQANGLAARNRLDLRTGYATTVRIGLSVDELAA